MPNESPTGMTDPRPTFFVGGEEKPELLGGLNSLTVAENTSGLYRCEARFGNWGLKDSATDYLYFDRQVLDFGKDFQVKLGDGQLFDGRLMGLEAGFP